MIRKVVQKIRMGLTNARTRANRLAPHTLVLIFFLFYGSVFTATLARYEWNPTALVRFGHYYIHQNPDHTPPGTVRLLGNEKFGGNGYDGQIFYYYARVLHEKGTWPKGFAGSYRWPRVGYPLLASLFAPAGAIFGPAAHSWAIIAGLILAQLILIPLSMLCLRALLPAEQRYLTLFYLFSPFAVQNFNILTSDGVMLALVVMGLFYYLRLYRPREGGFTSTRDPAEAYNATGVLEISRAEFPREFINRGAAAAAFACFAMAVLTKEQAVLILAPLGLFALLRRDWPRVVLMLAILLPMLGWQFYLRSVHGAVPIGFWSIFPAPFQGILGLFQATFKQLGEIAAAPSLGAFIAFAKQSARILLVGLILGGIIGVLTGGFRRLTLNDTGGFWSPFRMAIGLTLLSVCIADYYYFWGVYENISRMFAPLVPAVILLKAADSRARVYPFLFVLALLALMVFLRLTVLAPTHPFDIWYPYTGPSYPQAPMPWSW